jgi:hypothetical protein
LEGVDGTTVVLANILIGVVDCAIIAEIFFSAPFLSHNVWINFRFALSVSSILRIFSLKK